ncbi:MAG TPA: LacI family DNA-binding transcriptional regulator [Capsulimonadaceae bacterium]|jgi:LacI family transcriptional regulator
MPITLKDIADRTGVSPSVVSTVLSGRDNGTFVSKETRERVLHVAQELNYIPVRSGRPRGSRRLRRQRVEQFIGVWTPELDTQAALNVQALQKALHVYCTQHGPTPGEDFDYGIRLISDTDLPRLDMLGVMGLIVVGDTVLPRIAAAATTPTVLLGEADDTPREMVAVHMDNFSGGRAIGDYLWKLGHRRVAFVAPSAKPRARVTRQRWQGIQSVWVDQGTPTDWCVPAPYDTFRNLSLKEQVQKMVTALLNPTDPEAAITAIVCFNEAVATYVIQSLTAAGKRVPVDVSVAAFGDTPGGSEALSPALTTVRAPMVQLATTAIAQLYALHREAEEERSYGLGDHRRDIAYPGELVIRSSCGPVAD